MDSSASDVCSLVPNGHAATSVLESVGTFETCRRGLTMSLFGVDRKSSVDVQSDVNDPDRNSREPLFNRLVGATYPA